MDTAILPEVNMGNRVTIGGGSIVSRDIPNNSVPVECLSGRSKALTFIWS